VSDTDQAPTVGRDAMGVPHLRAGDVMALARLQGQVTALDRAWQIEHHRWRMEGRTAEYVGVDGLEWDRFARQVRLEPTVRECYERLDPETREWLTAYVDGVNEGMPEGLAGVPEVELLGLSSYAAQPRPWEPWTPLGIFWGIHLLFGTFPSKLFNGHVAARVGEHVLPLIHAEGGEHSGSNAWVIGGHRTASGLPLLAGDPHRTIELPGCYQQVGLACPEFDVVGFTFPGVPGVQHFAHAGEVAWGITNAMADYQDLTLESLRLVADGAGGHGFEARGIDDWEPVDHHVELVHVRGEGDVAVPVVVTSRGPIITGLDEEVARAESAHGQGSSDSGDFARRSGSPAPPANPPAYSLRTPTQAERDLGFAALLPLLRARSVDDVQAALSRWVEPVNSALVADTSGVMRHLVVGRVPDRHDAGKVLPLPAWDPRHLWHGYTAGPATDVTDLMVSANDRASGGGLGVEYATPFRANRIRELVEQCGTVTVDDCATFHVDLLNGQAALMHELVAAADVEGPASAVRDELLAWNSHSDIRSRGAAVFAAWRTAFVRWFSEQPQLVALHEPHGHSRIFSPWTNVVGQLGAGWHSLARGAGSIGIDVAAGVCEALERVAAQADSVTVWGDRHWLDPLHSLDGVGGAPSVPEDAVPGDKGCVLAAASAPGVTERCYGGPVARYVWDLADRDASRWVVPFGASGDARDEHFADQTAAWLTGRLHRVT
jgi:penicillin amidase